MHFANKLILGVVTVDEEDEILVHIPIDPQLCTRKIFAATQVTLQFMGFSKEDNYILFTIHQFNIYYHVIHH